MNDQPMDFLFRGEMRIVVDSLDETKAIMLLRAIMDFGVLGNYETDDPIIASIMCSLKPGIESSQGRYSECVSNGKTGGRPSKVNYIDAAMAKSDGLSNEDIAAKFGVSVSTIKRTLKQPPSEEKEIIDDLKNSLRVDSWIHWYIKAAVKKELAQVRLRIDDDAFVFRYINSLWESKYMPDKVRPHKSRADAIYKSQMYMEQDRHEHRRYGEAGMSMREFFKDD